MVRSPRAFVWLLPLLSLMGCGGESGGGGGLAGARRVILAQGDGSGGLHPDAPREFSESFRRLQECLELGEDQEARMVLLRMRALDPGPDVLDLLEGYERILDGRELVRGLDLWIEPQADPAVAGRYQLFLVASCHGPAVELLTTGARLRCRLQGMDMNGADHRRLQNMHVEAARDLDLVPGNIERRLLGEVDLPVGGSTLALRATCDLILLAGEVEASSGPLATDGRLPAQRVPVQTAEFVNLASYLPNEPVSPEELERYFREELLGKPITPRDSELTAEVLHLPRILERTVRILPSERERALDLVTPIFGELIGAEREYMLPCLRWLSGSSEHGGDIEAWSRWLTARAEARSQAAERVAPDLPD